MIREGDREVTLRYLAKHPNKLAINNMNDGSSFSLIRRASVNLSPMSFSGRGADKKYRKKAQQQGRNIRHYSQYLLERARSFREVKVDYVRDGEGRLKRQSVEKGLLREVESVQAQIGALLKCDVGDLLSNCLGKETLTLGTDPFRRNRERNNPHGFQTSCHRPARPLSCNERGRYQYPR